jgi:hypothetical protein
MTRTGSTRVGRSFYLLDRRRHRLQLHQRRPHFLLNRRAPSRPLHRQPTRRLLRHHRRRCQRLRHGRRHRRRADPAAHSPQSRERRAASWRGSPTSVTECSGCPRARSWPVHSPLAFSPLLPQYGCAAAVIIVRSGLAPAAGLPRTPGRPHFVTYSWQYGPAAIRTMSSLATPDSNRLQ